MAVDPQEYENDPIIEALGITEDARPVVPPVDVVYGHFQRIPPKFRLFLETWGLYMEGPLGRLLLKGKASKNRSQLVLRADGNYPDDITIGFTSLAGEVGTEPAAPTHMALYRTAPYAKTTPWHE